jgi:hypothetical protein
MRIKNKLLLLFATIAGFVLYSTPLFCGGGGKEEAIVKKVSTIGLTGAELILINWYNDQRIFFAVAVTLIMGTVGITIALVTDLLLKALGLEVSKIAHHE